MLNSRFILFATGFWAASLCNLGHAENLVENGHFDLGLNGWTSEGDVSIINAGGWENGPYVQLRPAASQSAQIIRTISGLTPTTRYTVAARVRTTNKLAPPILGIRDGAQIEKAHGWVALGDENQWLERRFEVFTNPDATSLDVILQAWQTDLDVVVDVDHVRLVRGRDNEIPAGDWRTPPAITPAPSAGENIIVNGGFTEGSEAWAMGINAEIVDGPAVRLTSGPDTSRCTQSVGLALPPETSWTITCEARVDPGVVASMYVEAPDGFSSSTPISHTTWHPVSLTLTTGASWVSSPTLKLENWKNQPGSAWFRNVQWIATGKEWSPTTDLTPEPQTSILHETFDHGLDPNLWLLSNKAWGGDNGGVTPENITIVDDVDGGMPIRALRLEAHGDLYEGDVIANGRKTRVGAAIATRQYFASGRYTVRARIAPEKGAVTAFWPFHYIDYAPSEAGYWHEPNPRRNTEIDWEFPTDLMGTGEAEAAEFGLDPSDIAFTNARTNSWGGQFGGEGGEHKGRIVLKDANGDIIDLATDWHQGVYHDFTIEWRSGAIDPASDGDERLWPGSVRWYIDDVLVDELIDPDFGQGNVPYRAARFWLGVWFPAAGYGDEVGWGGAPDFADTATYIASVTIEPLLEPRDLCVRETVPNLAWATPDAYPENPCFFDLNQDGLINTEDLLALLDSWEDHGVSGLLSLLAKWGPCQH